MKKLFKVLFGMAAILILLLGGCRDKEEGPVGTIFEFCPEVCNCGGPCEAGKVCVPCARVEYPFCNVIPTNCSTYCKGISRTCITFSGT